MKALFQALWALFAPAGTKPALYTNLAGQMYANEAPMGTKLPYVVYFMPSGTVRHAWPNDHLEVVRIQFDIYAGTKTAAADLYENLKTLYDNCTLSITGYNFGKMERASFQELRDPDGHYWRWIVEYEVMADA